MTAKHPLFYPNAQAWADAPAKRVMLFGMSGLGKTFLSTMLRADGGWFHYSVDYRIGTRYMGEHITDNAKREAMKVPFLAELLRSNSIYIASNITFGNLAPLSTYLGKPGDPAKGGIPIADYRSRQDLHRKAEIAAMLDTSHFIDRAKALYGYENFVCDTSGSICEVVDPSNPDDPVMRAVAGVMLPVWIKGSDAHTEELVRRFDRDPKPMYYQPAFLTQCWAEYLRENNTSEGDVDPDAFVRWTYARALAHRAPLYEAMADWGVTVLAEEVETVKTPADFTDLIARALERQAS